MNPGWRSRRSIPGRRTSARASTGARRAAGKARARPRCTCSSPARPSNRSQPGCSRPGGSCRRLQGAAADLIELHRLEQRAEVAFAEALVTFTLDDLEEDRTDHRLGEDLQQQAAAGRAIEGDLPLLQVLQVFSMTR